MPTLDQVAAGAHEVAETAAAVAMVSESIEATVTATDEIVKSGSRAMRYMMWTVIVIMSSRRDHLRGRD